MKKTYKEFDTELTEILGFAARKKLKLRMKRLVKQASFQFKRKLKKWKPKRMADAMKQAAKKVFAFFKQRIVGKARDLSAMGITQKMNVEKQAKARMSRISPGRLKAMKMRKAKQIVKKHRIMLKKMKANRAAETIKTVKTTATKAGAPKKDFKAMIKKMHKKQDAHVKDKTKNLEKEIKTKMDKKLNLTSLKHRLA